MDLLESGISKTNSISCALNGDYAVLTTKYTRPCIKNNCQSVHGLVNVWWGLGRSPQKLKGFVLQKLIYGGLIHSSWLVKKISQTILGGTFASILH